MSETVNEKDVRPYDHAWDMHYDEFDELSPEEEQLCGKAEQMSYNKLVRDRIPDIIRSNGGEPRMHILTEEEHKSALLRKLEEETKELVSAKAQKDICEECADVLEVVYAIAAANGLAPAAVEGTRLKKLAAKGGFSKRIFLETVL